MRTALIVRIAPAVDRSPDPAQVRDLAGWVRCAPIAGDAELGPLPLWAPTLSAPGTELDAEELAELGDAWRDAPVLLAELDDGNGPGWVVLLGPVLPTAWEPSP